MTRPPRHTVRHAALAALALPVFCAMALGLPGAAEAKATKAVPTLRVMLNPLAAPRGTLPDAARGRLTALVGAPVALVGTTRTVRSNSPWPGPRHRGARVDAGRLRGDRLVLWAEAGSPRTVQPKSSTAAERDIAASY